MCYDERAMEEWKGELNGAQLVATGAGESIACCAGERVQRLGRLVNN